MLKKAVIFLLILIIPVDVVYAKNISAASYAVFDSQSGKLLLSKNENKATPMASTTKIMTCLLACEKGNLSDVVTVTSEMLDKTEGTLINLKPNNKITLYDLVVGSMLASGNDSANAIACHISGSVSEFVKLMNTRAKEIGMNNTIFVTPSGLDSENHHSSAYDMGLLACEATKNKTLMDIAKLQSARIKIDGEVYNVNNHNKLLKKNPYFTGLKTGYTQKAGRCLISVYNNRGSNIVVVTMNANDDWNDHVTLVNNAKKKYNTFSDKNEVYIKTLSTKDDTLKCTYAYTVSSLESVWVKIYYYPIVYLPVRKGDIMGYVEVYSHTSLITTVDLISQENK